MGVNGDAGGAIELAAARTRLAHSHFQLAVRREHLKAVVAPIGDVDVPKFVDVDAPGQVELPGRAAEFAEPVYVLAVGGVALDAVVARVHNG